MADNQEKMWSQYQNSELFSGYGCKSGGRLESLVKKIPDGGNVLNIGVGLGRLEELLASKAIKMYSVDPNESSINSLKASLNMDERAKVGYSQDIPFQDEMFDIVVMSEVIEHLPDEIIEPTLKEVKRVLKPSGKFIGTVPADENLKESLVVCPKCGDIFHRWGHHQTFSQERLNQMLSEQFNDVTVVRKRFVDLGSLNWKGKIFSYLWSGQAYLGAKGSGQNFYFEAH